MSQGTDAYDRVTGRLLSVKTLEWIDRLETKFGEARVAAAIMAESRGDPNKLLGRTSDRLHRENPYAGERTALVELAEGELLAVVRGDRPAPPRPYTYDSRGLTPEEYTEVLKWADARRTA